MNASSTCLIGKISVNITQHRNPQFTSPQTRSSLRFSNTHWYQIGTEYSLQLLSKIMSTSLNKDIFSKDIFSLFGRISYIYIYIYIYTYPYLSIITGDTRGDTQMTSTNHPLMIPLHGLWVKLNNRPRG